MTALAIAVAAFPHEPLIPLALVVGPLLELSPLSVVFRLPPEIRDRDPWGATPTPASESK